LVPAAPMLLGIAALTNVASVALKATVWKLSLEASPGVGRVRHRTLLAPLFIGYLCNSVFMFRVGDVARIADARRRLRRDGHGTSTAAVAGSAIAEQLVLGLALVALAAVLAATAVPMPRWVLWTLIATAGGLIAAGMAALHGQHRSPKGDGRPARLAR